MREKEKSENVDIREIYKKNKQIKRCDLHPLQLSEKCRYD